VIIYFVRHGETAHNRDGLALGRADVPLTEAGRQQAAAAARRLAALPLDHIYTSPLARCAATAEALAGERGITVEARDELLELDVGETEGLTFQVMRDRYAGFLGEWAGPEGHLARMPGGERLVDVEERVMPFLDRLRRERPHAAVAVVSHNFVIRLAIARLLGLPAQAFRSIAADVASVSTLRARDDGSVSVRSLNDRCHISHLES
jgi:broad specificity phosphatase PhoE